MANKRRSKYRQSMLQPSGVSMVHQDSSEKSVQGMDSLAGVDSGFWSRARVSLPAIKIILWRLFDNLVLLQMGSTYVTRFREFAMASEGQNLIEINEWRVEQQEEWNRLSMILALLATMQAAILAIEGPIPELAFSLWLGGASLSVCGVFVVQYFPIKAFSITDAHMGLLVQPKDNVFVNSTLLATAVASPVVILLWATILFVLGMFDYIAKSKLGSLKYKLIAGTPLVVGVLCMVGTMVIGEVIEVKLKRVRNSETNATSTSNA